jgi:phosphoadenosine phosphosulfate reductase
MSKFTQAELDEINATIKTPQDALKWALDNLHTKVAKASSFGAEDSVIIDMMTKINPESRFFTLDTGRLNQETYDVMDELEKKYNIHFEVMFPDALEVEEMVKTKGINLFYDSPENRRLCCGIRKVHPLKRILSTLDGWITGIRKDQTTTRENASFIEIDEKYNGILKINPLLDWTWEQVWNYIKENNIPYHKLLDKGYPSIGCEPCTRAIKDGEDLRAGRWWWESDENKECGLHMDHGV